MNAIKAKYGGYVSLDAVAEAGGMALSEPGFEQVRAFAEEMRKQGVAVPEDFETEGILEMDDHYVLIVPAHVVAEPRSTVGMGDTISSSSFSYEWNKKKNRAIIIPRGGSSPVGRVCIHETLEVCLPTLPGFCGAK